MHLPRVFIPMMAAASLTSACATAPRSAASPAPAAATSGGSPTKPAAAATTAAATPQKQKLVCYDEAPTGSHIRSRRYCITEEEAEERARQTQDDLRRATTGTVQIKR